MNDSATDKRVLIFETRGKETQLYNTTTVCLGLGGRKKHMHTTGEPILQTQTSMEGEQQHPRRRLHLRRSLTEPRDSYASGIRIPHSSPSVKSNSRSDKQFCYRQISPDTRNRRKGNTALQHDDSVFWASAAAENIRTLQDEPILQAQTSM